MKYSPQVVKALEWLHKAQHDSGGFAANMTKSGHQGTPYPEVTGYLIPTLFKYDLRDKALRAAEFLIRIQHKNGAVHGAPLDDTPRTLHVFDTAMVAAGLLAAYQETLDEVYLDGYSRAITWVRDHLPIDIQTPLYQVKAAAVIGIVLEMWRELALMPEFLTEHSNRSHYVAYMLEGFRTLNIDMTPLLSKLDGLARPFPFFFGGQSSSNSTCIVGNFQLSILLGDQSLFEMMEGWQRSDGGFTSSVDDTERLLWTLCYYLEAAYAFGAHTK